LRIRELNLKAFGPFTETRIQFPDLDSEAGLGPGLCVIYGPNEIGKSSALRAIRDLIYGIPGSSPDNFIHPYKQMRVGARVVFADGEEFGFFRRKGTKDTLLEYSGANEAGSSISVETPTTHVRFEELVRAVPIRVFENFYGLDHRGLTRGSNELLENEGELGQALFSAGLGGANLRSVLDELSAEAEALFKVRGSAPPINAALRDLDAIKKDMKAKALAPATWKEAFDASAKVESRLEKLEADIEEAQAERTRLDRIRRTLPALGRYRLAYEEFSIVADSRELVPDFEERLRDAKSTAHHAEETLSRMAALMTRLEVRRGDLKSMPALLEARTSIEALVERIGAYQDEVDQLPRRAAELAGLDQDIRSTLELMGRLDSPEAIAEFRAPLSRVARIREISTSVIETETRLEAAAERRDAATANCARWEEELASLTSHLDPADLRRALDQGRKLGDIDARLAFEASEIAVAEEDCERSLESASRWSGPLDDIDRIAFPEAETVEAFAGRFEELGRRHERLDEEQRRLAAERREIEEQWSRLTSEGSVPSESDRDTQRRSRDQSWLEIRHEWLENGSKGGSGHGEEGGTSARENLLADRFRTEIDAADETADRLWSEAGRVAQQAQIIAKLDRSAAEIAACGEQQSELGCERADWQREWESLWDERSIAPGSVPEMRAWLSRVGRLRDSVQGLRKQRRDWSALVSARDDARGRIEKELTALGEGGPDRAEGSPLEETIYLGDAVQLGDAIHFGEKKAIAHENARSHASRIRKDLEQARRDAEGAEAGYQKFLTAQQAVELELSESVDGLGLDAHPRPTDVLERLETLGRLFERARDREKLTGRVDQMRNNVGRFANAVADLVERCAPELQEAHPDVAVVRLRDLLVVAADLESTRIEIEASVQEASDEIETANRTLASVEDEMAKLRLEAAVSKDSDFESAILDSARLVRARNEFERQEAHLVELGEGRPTSELESEAKSIESDSLPGRIEQLDRLLEDWKQEQHDAFDERSDRRNELARMDGSEQVARLAEEAQSRLASIEVDVRRYAELVLGREILARAIEGYRQRNQAPVLGRTTELFRALTNGNYHGVESEYDEGDKPQLVAVQTDGERKAVPALSAGTRDQLFLALRLATLVETLDRGEPMPLILDDILIEFDEKRSRAALEVMADLGRKTQILLFSHHAHIAEQAREMGSRAHVIEL